MAQFTYQATNKKGGTVSGTVEAANRSAAIAALTHENLKPISVKEKRENNDSFSGLSSRFFKNKIKPDVLVIFTRQLSTMVGAGVPLLRALNALQQHAENPLLKSTLEQVATDVQGGASLADALEKHPVVFSDVYVNMVRAGEAAGILEDVLKRLAMQQEKSATIRKKVKGAMIYPMVLLSVTTIAFFGLMIFVIPNIGKIIKDIGGEDAELPALTQIMLGISDFTVSYWYILIALGFGIFFAVSRYLRTPSGKRNFHRLILKIPIVRGLVKKVAVARFARTFSSLMGAGVTVLAALKVTGKAIGNTVYMEFLDNAAEEVKNGKQLSEVIAKSDLFPDIVGQMLAVGEETGKTDTVLVKVADFYEEEVDVAVNSLSSIIEPLMIIVLGAMVGLVAASVMGPITSISQNIQQ